MEYSYDATLHAVSRAVLDSASSLDSTRFCNLQPNQTFSNLDQCDIENYGKALAYIAAPGIVLGALCFVASFILLFGLCCCRCCKRQSSKVTIGVMMIVAAAIAIVGLVITLTGNGRVDDGVSGLTTTITGTAEDIIQRLDRIGELIGNLTNDPSTQDAIAEASNAVQQIKATVDSANSDYISPYNTYRHTAIFIGCIVPPVMIGLGLLFIFLKINLCVALTSWLLMFIVLVVWVSLSVHIVVNEVVLDICYEVDLLVDNPGTAGDSPLNIFFACTKNDTAFQDLRDVIEDTKNDLVGDACTIINDLCTNNHLNCTGYVCSEATLNNVTDRHVNDVVFECTDGSYADDPALCPGGATGNEDRQIIPVRDCPTQCKNGTGMQQIWAGNALQATAMVFGSIVLAHAFCSASKPGDGMV